LDIETVMTDVGIRSAATLRAPAAVPGMWGRTEDSQAQNGGLANIGSVSARVTRARAERPRRGVAVVWQRRKVLKL
jgi:hypothetical protein